MQSTVTDSDLQLRSGRVHLRDHGGDGPLALCVPGLSANATSFDALAEHLAARGRRAVALDLRGRGRSPATPPGTYGWPAHARDVLEVAEQLAGDAPVDLIGHSMGAYVVLSAIGQAPERVRRGVLVDGAGRPDRGVLPPILQAVERLDRVVPNADEYIARVRAIGTITPWGDLWERYFRYELVDVDGGVRSRTSRAAVEEDVRWGGDHDQRDLWPGVTRPVLLVRALQPLGDTGAFVVGVADRDRFLERVPGATVVEVDANHYGVVAHPETAAAVTAFLDQDDG